jgi:hypothetical protein
MSRAGARPTTLTSEMMGPDALATVSRRIRNEYLEMPGLSLTLGQAQRMWQLRPGECETLLAGLVDSGFLARTAGGAFVRAGTGRAGA